MTTAREQPGGEMDFVTRYLDEVVEIAERIDREAIARLLDLLVDVRTSGGRLFIPGVGGSAANASHAVNDFRKIAAKLADAYVSVPGIDSGTVSLER